MKPQPPLPHNRGAGNPPARKSRRSFSQTPDIFELDASRARKSAGREQSASNEPAPKSTREPPSAPAAGAQSNATAKAASEKKAGPLRAQPDGASNLQTVRLAFFSDKAQSVCVAGTFNQWRLEATPLQPQGGGQWAVDLKLAPGEYEYRFLVDGVWTDDLTAARYVSNPFGGSNAVLQVG